MTGENEKGSLKPAQVTFYRYVRRGDGETGKSRLSAICKCSFISGCLVSVTMIGELVRRMFYACSKHRPKTMCGIYHLIHQ